MQLIDGQLIVSATDLVGFLECSHLTSLDLAAAAGELPRPVRNDPELELIQRRGLEHERQYLARLEAEARSVRDVTHQGVRTPDELRAAEADTVAAMRSGADVVYQATFFDGRWRGHADFLLRVERPSSLGDWSYEVADTKLARRVKAAALLQMCVYVDRLTQLQGGIQPESMYVVTGDGIRHPHRVADYVAYYRMVKARFEERLFTQGPPPATYPDPVEHCRVCPWYGSCADRRRADDHLSRVANISGSQTDRLIAAGIPTLTALGRLDPAISVPEMSGVTLTRLREQARLQLDQYATGRTTYELIPPNPEEPGRGLAALPVPSPLDVFFDIESDPWAQEGGLEYLFGVVEGDAGEPRYLAWWAHDAEGERRAFEGFIDYVIDRLERDPGMHIYHYAPYEPTALKRLMGRYATREDEVDRLLRGGVLVDLYAVVRQGIRVSEERYSIKNVEHLYMPVRSGPITQAGFSVVEYEKWMEVREQAILDGLEAYNRDDCVSTWLLRAWLEERRDEAASLYGGTVPRPQPVDGKPPESLSKTQAETRRRSDLLRVGVPDDRAERSEVQQGQWLLAALLDWHRREAKPQWWAHYFLLGASMEELFRSGDAIAGLEFVKTVDRPKQSTVDRYRFDPAQEYKFREGNTPVDPMTDAEAGEVVVLDEAAGTIDLRRGPSRQGSHPHALIPGKPIGTDTFREALGRVADYVILHGLEGPGPYRAVRELILQRGPDIADVLPGEPLVREGLDLIAEARGLARSLRETCLPVQGPPGSGKTYTGARMIVELLARGRTVGITATAHKAITNLLDMVAEAAGAEGIALRAVQVADEGVASPASGVERGSPANVGSGLRAGQWNVAAGTGWLFTREDMEGTLDVLFTDEAGQMSLANVVAMGGAARSIVLLGDPNQLPQVSQGTHPDGAELSALEHLLNGQKTVPPSRGVFLERTWRMHPDVNRFISEAFYEGRLKTHPSTALQALDAGPVVGGVGLRFVTVRHATDDQVRSRDEARFVVDVIEALQGRRWVDRDNRVHALTPDDVLIVAPYNAQVAEISRQAARAGLQANVGTVDRFQGQERPVAIYSMATSSPEEAPRGINFLYSGNRLNVAISRAKGLALLVCSPDLLLVTCHTPDQMRLANALCEFVELADIVTP